MNRKLIELVERDAPARTHILLWAIGVMTVSGFLADLSGLIPAAAMLVSAVAGGIVISLQVAIYVQEREMHGRKRHKLKIPSVSGRQLGLGVLSIAAISLSAMLLARTSPIVEAAMLNHRLESILENPHPKMKASEAQSILNLASSNKIILKPYLISTAISKVGVTTPEWQDTVDSINKRYQRFSPAQQVTEMDLVGGSYIEYDGMALRYGGQPIKLNHAFFKNVRFSIAENENGKKFAQALLNSTNGEITVEIP